MAHASESLTAFAGKALEAVRGFASSNLRSTIRLNPMAQVLAPTIANTIQPNVVPPGTPCADRKAPIKANGSAKTVCSNLIISSNMVIFFNIDLSASLAWIFHEMRLLIIQGVNRPASLLQDNRVIRYTLVCTQRA